MYCVQLNDNYHYFNSQQAALQFVADNYGIKVGDYCRIELLQSDKTELNRNDINNK